MPRAFLLLIVLVSTIPPMLADVFTVGPGGTHASIQDAVDAAIALGGDNEIRLQQATYNASVLISDALTSGSLLLDGGWTAGFSQRAADRSLTILSGEMMRRVLEIDSPAGAVTIQNLTIQDGFHVNRGAGINIECSTCTARFAALRLSGNRADATGSKSDERALGAAIYGVLAGTGRLEIDDCDIENNLTRGVSTGLGAVGLELKGSAQAVLQGSRWIGNQNHGDSTRGAGLDVVAADSSSLDIFACKFNANSNVSAGSTTVGGGLNLNLEDNSVFSIRESEFRGNRHTNPESQSTGTELFVGINDRAEGEFVDNQILENESAGEGGDVGSGGAIWLKGEATVVIERTEWMSNTSDSSPPQLSLIVQGSSSMVFRDSLVADGSSVGIGSFVDDPESEMRLVNITAADHANRALLISGPGTKSVYNSVFFNNGDEPLFGKGTDLGNNLIGVDPFFIDPGGGDYRLSPGSPAVDGGNDVPPGGLAAISHRWDLKRPPCLV